MVKMQIFHLYANKFDVLFGTTSFCLGMLLAFHSGLPTAHGQENVAVVVNAESPNSKAIANHYVQLRSIPANNVIYLESVPIGADGISTFSKAFKANILDPLQSQLNDRGISQQIDTIAFSSGFPTRITCNPEGKNYTDAKGVKYQIHFHAPYLSLTSGVFFGQSVFDSEPYFMDPDANWYARPMSTQTRAFSSQPEWTAARIQSKATSRKYVLCSALAVVGKNASTLKQAIEQIRRSAQADGSMPKGIFYFADNSDPRSKTRSGQFKAAADALQQEGYRVEIGAGRMPPKGTKVLGAVLGSPKLDWSTSGAEFAPGAIADNFTSYGGWFTRDQQTQVTHFLNNGAAGGSGTVYEPYTIPYKIPTAMAHLHYVRGCTLAESLYQTVGNPFQLLIVGDPICRPFAKPLKFAVEGISDRSLVTEDLNIVASVQSNDPGIDHFLFYFDGRETSQPIQPEQPIKLALDDMVDGYHEIRIVAIGDSDARVRTSQKFDVFVRKAGFGYGDLKLEIEETRRPLSGHFRVRCDYPETEQAVVRQNSRIVGRLARPGEPIKIPAAELGQGPSRLFVTLEKGDQSVAGIPVEVNVLPSNQ